jgi:hypothetical protein
LTPPRGVTKRGYITSALAGVRGKLASGGAHRLALYVGIPHATCEPLGAALRAIERDRGHCAE